MHPSRELTRDAPPPTPEQSQAVADLVESQTNDGANDVMLLQRWNGKLLAEEFQLPEMEVEIERAVEQVEKSIKANEELINEKTEIEKATRPEGVSEEAVEQKVDAEMRPKDGDAATKP